MIKQLFLAALLVSCIYSAAPGGQYGPVQGFVATDCTSDTATDYEAYVYYATNDTASGGCSETTNGGPDVYTTTCADQTATLYGGAKTATDLTCAAFETPTDQANATYELNIKTYTDNACSAGEQISFAATQGECAEIKASSDYVQAYCDAEGKVVTYHASENTCVTLTKKITFPSPSMCFAWEGSTTYYKYECVLVTNTAYSLTQKDNADCTGADITYNKYFESNSACQTAVDALVKNDCTTNAVGSYNISASPDCTATAVPTTAKVDTQVLKKTLYTDNTCGTESVAEATVEQDVCGKQGKAYCDADNNVTFEYYKSADCADGIDFQVVYAATESKCLTDGDQFVIFSCEDSPDDGYIDDGNNDDGNNDDGDDDDGDDDDSSSLLQYSLYVVLAIVALL